jgi:hypothetical protein
MTYIINHSNYNFLVRNYEDDPSYQHDLDYKVINETWEENVYRIHDGDFNESKIFVDVGANIGSVRLFVDNFNKNRKVFRGCKNPLVLYIIDNFHNTLIWLI